MNTNPNYYVVVFDISREGYGGWWFIIIPLVIACLGIFIVVVEGRRRFGRAPATAGLFFAALVFSTTFNEYRRLQDDLRQGHALSVEGYVTEFRSDDNAGHVPETFSVRGVPFTVAPAQIRAALRPTVSAGGPDLTSACARVLYVRDLGENKIVWLGLRQSNCPDSQVLQ
ncbi:MAG: hypothetical protein JSS00_13635 [Proteobacteria bacterium]|nr:hypothetical protein [Pseudomonadota bacterium]